MPSPLKQSLEQTTVYSTIMFSCPKLYLLKENFVNINMSEISDFNKRTHNIINIHIIHTLRINL